MIQSAPGGALVGPCLRGGDLRAEAQGGSPWPPAFRRGSPSWLWVSAEGLSPSPAMAPCSEPTRAHSSAGAGPREKLPPPGLSRDWHNLTGGCRAFVGAARPEPAFRLPWRAAGVGLPLFLASSCLPCPHLPCFRLTTWAFGRKANFKTESPPKGPDVAALPSLNV